MRRMTSSILFAAAVSAATVGPLFASQSNDRAGDVSKDYRTGTGKTIVVSTVRRFFILIER